MKKLFIILLSLVILVGCNSPTDYQTQIDDLQAQLELINEYDDTQLVNEIDNIETSLQDYVNVLTTLQNYDDTEILQELETIQNELFELQTRLDNLTIVYGLNGQTSVYENVMITMTTLSTQIKDTFDKTKAPAYMLDINGEYVSYSSLMIKLKEKYFNDIDTGIYDSWYDEFNDVYVNNTIFEDYYEMSSQAKIMYGIDTRENQMNDDEILARAMLLIEELRLYEFYVLSCSTINLELYIQQGNYTHQIHIQIPLVVVINDMFDITLDGIISQDYEMKITTDGYTTNQTIAQQYYDNFILNGTFAGYVLDYGG